MKILDTFSENTARKVARHTSRRGFLGKFGALIVGASTIPLLPVARAASEDNFKGKTSGASTGRPGISPQSSLSVEEEGDPTSCDYWRYCGLGGQLCACCGGSANACPPGSEMSLLAWVGTCHNPVDGKNYIISYNDCCGKPICKRCSCHPHNPDNRPVVRPQSSDGYLWCLGMKESTLTCTTANVIGVALDQG